MQEIIINCDKKLEKMAKNCNLLLPMQGIDSKPTGELDRGV